MLSRNEVKYITSLYHKKNSGEKVFIAEGVKLLQEILHSDLNIKKIYAVADWINLNRDIKNITEISGDDLNKISNFKTPNKVLAIVEKKPAIELPSLKNKITLVLDDIQDPGNFGTIIRTADWFGIENIIASNDTADVYNAKVIQSTMGSFLRANIFYVDLKTFFTTNNIPVYGAVLKGKDINAYNKIEEGLIIIGNESQGISEEILPFIQNKITIPKIGHAESLNAAVATGIILWQLIDR